MTSQDLLISLILIVCEYMNKLSYHVFAVFMLAVSCTNNNKNLVIVYTSVDHPYKKENKAYAGKYYALKGKMFRVLNIQNADYEDFTL